MIKIQFLTCNSLFYKYTLGEKPFINIIKGDKLMEDRSFKARLLVADDEVHIRDILRDFFQRKKYQVDTASTGREVIEKLKTDKPDILLLDLRMPDMNGEDVLKFIDDNRISVGIIIITGYPGEVKDRKLLNRTYDFIVKPFDLEYLNNTVLTKVVLLAEG
jgi:DNA-binding NtrC family response regulator